MKDQNNKPLYSLIVFYFLRIIEKKFSRWHISKMMTYGHLKCTELEECMGTFKCNNKY